MWGCVDIDVGCVDIDVGWMEIDLGCMKISNNKNLLFINLI